MKVIINNAEMVPTPKKGTIIRFGDCGLFVIGIYVGRKKTLMTALISCSEQLLSLN